MNYLPNNQKGQALLIVLLSMAVVLTITLSILSRSVTDIKISSQDEDSLRAFSAAEAGVEQALVGISGPFDFGNAQVSASVINFAEGTNKFAFPANFFSQDQVYTWFVGHNADGDPSCAGPCFTGESVVVCWGEAGTSADNSMTPALEASIYYALTPGDYKTVQIARITADPNVSRRTSNSFAETDGQNCQISNRTLAFKKTINFSSLGIPSAVYNAANGLQFMTLRLIYNQDQAQPLGVDGGSSVFPSQGKMIESKGSSGLANRRLEVFQSYQEIPIVFASSVFSSGALIK